MTILAITGTRRQVRELVDGTLEVKIHVEPRHKGDFHELFPDIDMPVALAPLWGSQAAPPPPEEPKPASPPEKPANRLAQHLMVMGYFRNPKLWDAIEAGGFYSQKEHKAWIEKQPCVATTDGEIRRRTADLGCSGEVCAHHTPSATLPAAGKGRENPRKVPHWNTVPACQAHHDWFHASSGATREDKAHLVAVGVALAADQMKAKVKSCLGIASLADVTIERLNEIEDALDLPATIFKDGA